MATSQDALFSHRALSVTCEMFLLEISPNASRILYSNVVLQTPFLLTTNVCNYRSLTRIVCKKTLHCERICSSPFLTSQVLLRHGKIVPLAFNPFQSFFRVVEYIQTVSKLLILVHVLAIESHPAGQC